MKIKITKAPSLTEWTRESMMNGNGFDEFFKENYPIQAFFRITVHDFIDMRWWRLQEFTRKMKRVFVGENESTVSLVPDEYMDKVELIPHMLLQMTLDFQKEANKSYVDYVERDSQREFKEWLDKTCHIITDVMPYVEKRVERAYEVSATKHGNFEEIYGHVTKWEKYSILLQRSTCKDIIDHLDYFWT